MKTEIKETKVPKRVVGRRLLKGLPMLKEMFYFEGDVPQATYNIDDSARIAEAPVPGYFRLARKYPAIRVTSTQVLPTYVIENIETGRQMNVYDLPNNKIRVRIVNKTHPQYKELSRTASLRTLRNNPGITTGADPEIFFETKDKGEVVPAWTLVSKRSRLTPEESLYPDGFQAEWNVQAATCLDQVASSIERSLSRAKSVAASNNVKVSQKTVMPVTQEMLDAAPAEWAKFGCTPSMNAYGEEFQIPDGRTVPFRSAGGHIHYGMYELRGESQTAHEMRIKAVKALDKVLGVACVWMFREYDHPARRQFYGRAGEYRAPRHGLEYRPLSNAWLLNRVIMHLVLEMARKCVIAATQPMEYDILEDWDATEEETRDCINSTNPTKALEILKRNESIFKTLIRATTPAMFNENGEEAVWNMWIAGARCIHNNLGVPAEDTWRQGGHARNVSGFLASPEYKKTGRAAIKAEADKYLTTQTQKKAA